LLSLNKPFDGNNPAAVIVKIVRGKYDALEKSCYSELLELVLERNSKKRYNVQDILKCKDIIIFRFI
jgi:hypothetical protein